jgi:hypothetical protein
VAQEVVGEQGFRATLHLKQLLQSHFPVIFGASVIVGNISKAFDRHVPGGGAMTSAYLHRAKMDAQSS